MTAKGIDKHPFSNIYISSFFNIFVNSSSSTKSINSLLPSTLTHMVVNGTLYIMRILIYIKTVNGCNLCFFIITQ